MALFGEKFGSELVKIIHWFARYLTYSIISISISIFLQIKVPIRLAFRSSLVSCAFYSICALIIPSDCRLFTKAGGELYHGLLVAALTLVIISNIFDQLFRVRAGPHALELGFANKHYTFYDHFKESSLIRILLGIVCCRRRLGCSFLLYYPLFSFHRFLPLLYHLKLFGMSWLSIDRIIQIGEVGGIRHFIVAFDCSNMGNSCWLQCQSLLGANELHLSAGVKEKLGVSSGRIMWNLGSVEDSIDSLKPTTLKPIILPSINDLHFVISKAQSPFPHSCHTESVVLMG